MFLINETNKALAAARICSLAKRQVWLIITAITIGLNACTTTPLLNEGSPSFTLSNTTNTQLARRYQSQIKANHGKSGFALLGSGLDAFAARTTLFRLSQKSIDVQYYIVRDDLAGHLFFQELIAAANRGVRVRILLDDLSHAKQTARFTALDRHANIELRLFNPLRRNRPRLLQFALNFGQVTRRMHNKSIIIDNRVTIIGSRNIGNEYTELASSGQIFSGMEVLSVGPLANDVSAAFDRYWNYRHSIPLRQLTQSQNINPRHTGIKFADDPQVQQFKQIQQTSPLVRQLQNGTLPLHWANARLIVDPPDKIQRSARPNGQFLNNTALRPYIAKTREHLLIITPYFVPGREGIAFFRKLRARGVRVSILTNSYATSDVKTVNAHYKNYRKTLLAMGVELFEFKSVPASIGLLQRAQNIIALADRGGRASLHAKIINFDQSHLYIGSMNVDPRSIYANTEIGVIIESPVVSQRVLSWFKQNLNQLAYQLALENGRIIWRDLGPDSKTRTFMQEPDTSPLDRFFMHLVGLLPIENQL